MLYHLPFANRTHSLDRFNRKGILIIRNPFKAILAYRNFRFGGMAGMAPKEKFEGPGNQFLFELFKSQLKHQKIIILKNEQKLLSIARRTGSS